MSFETVIALINAAGLLLSLVAISIAFYVRATATDTTNVRCDKIQKSFEAKFEAAETKAAADIKIATTAAETVRRELEAEMRASTSGLYGRINGLGDRQHELESKVDDTARRADLFQLSLQLATISGEMKAITTRVESIAESSNMNSAALKRVENHLFQIQGQ